jgi:predicted small secreted protein
MKFFAFAVILFSVTSCNTLIGIGRDTKEGFIWTKNKIQESNQGGGGGYEEEYGAPVY